jgi:hypothetical protein
VDVIVLGDYAYIASGPEGLQVVDISNPATPALVDSYDTPGYSCDLFLDNKTLYLADMYSLMAFSSPDFYNCGEANGDEQINIGDAVFLISFVFKDGPAPNPLMAGDANCDGGVNVGDAVYLINYVFKDGPEPCCW